MNKLVYLTPVILIVALLFSVKFLMDSKIVENQKSKDRIAIQSILGETIFDNDPLTDAVVLPAKSTAHNWVNIDLLSLDSDRLAYRVKYEEEVVALIVPATADDGFNGKVDLLVAVDMFGRIKAARVLAPSYSKGIYGGLKLIESQWIKLFTNNTFRDIQRLSWQKIPADNEYDLFVGASVTPKTVSSKIYDTLIFVQSNRIALISEMNHDI